MRVFKPINPKKSEATRNLKLRIFNASSASNLRLGGAVVAAAAETVPLAFSVVLESVGMFDVISVPYWPILSTYMP
jgi:hypothetical protein